MGIHLAFLDGHLPAEFHVLAFGLILISSFFFAALVFTLLFTPKRVSSGDRYVITWLVYDFLVHVVLEGSFVFYSLTSNVLNSNGPLAEIWKEYYIADKRWGVSDATIVSLEILTVLFCSSLCILLIHAIFQKRPYRHYVQLVLCVCELYGGWMTFAPEWLTGNVNLVGMEDLMRHLLHLWFFNGMWVVIPLILMVQSWRANIAAFSSPISVSLSDKKTK